jgi:hypothetical protein
LPGVGSFPRIVHMLNGSGIAVQVYTPPGALGVPVLGADGAEARDGSAPGGARAAQRIEWVLR